MNPIDQYLEILELDQVPDLVTLEKTYRNLLKRNHPDLNRGQEELAHHTTREIIEANREVKKYIETRRKRNLSGSDEGFIRIRNHQKGTRVDRSSDLQKTYPEVKDTVRVQLMRSRAGEFGIPVSGIESIFFRKDASWVLPEQVLFYNDKNYHLEDLSGNQESSAHSPIIVFSAKNQNVALSFDDELQFAGIAEISPREVIDTRESSTFFRYLVHVEGQSYRIPSLG